MKRLICSAAVASALLAATAVPSGAASICLFGMRIWISCGVACTYPMILHSLLSVRIASLFRNGFIIADSEFNITGNSASMAPLAVSLSNPGYTRGYLWQFLRELNVAGTYILVSRSRERGDCPGSHWFLRPTPAIGAVTVPVQFLGH